MKPLLVGEANPYGRAPEFALYPAPRGCAGQRLAEVVMGLPRSEYLERFDRVNLCPEKWSAPVARASASKIRFERGVWDHIVLLGSKVCGAFGIEYKPFTWGQRAPHEARNVNTIVVLPHPSGLCRTWNEPDAVARAREVLRCSGVLP